MSATVAPAMAASSPIVEPQARWMVTGEEAGEEAGPEFAGGRGAGAPAA
ncbi:hypothetical protein [Streptomyces sp. CB02923]|nr:hypothetical protein [Streptomyces sp. CB02923]